MKEIGGYFELELSSKEEFHRDALKLNSGRNAFKYILKAQSTRKVHIPVFICNSIIESLEELNIKYDFYNINENFEINNAIVIKENEKLLYVNYYALKSEYIQTLSNMYGTKIIIDNTQAFFDLPIKNIDTIYSPRKFFGVSDGGYLYTNNLSDEELKKDISESYAQLIGRIQSGASLCYDSYQKAEKKLMNVPIKIMSRLTNKILKSIDYKDVIRRREQNFYFLHNELGKYNKLNLSLENIKAPFVYPFMSNSCTLRDELINNKIYVSKYWNEVLQRNEISGIEKMLVENIIPLPIDQRYGIEDMIRIIKVVKG